jgi:beta-glucanase (GH16 family)
MKWKNMKDESEYLDVDPQDDWHIYEIQWTPDWIAWLLNGEE